MSWSPVAVSSDSVYVGSTGSHHCENTVKWSWWSSCRCGFGDSLLVIYGCKHNNWLSLSLNKTEGVNEHEVHLPEVRHCRRKWTLRGDVRGVTGVVVHLSEREKGGWGKIQHVLWKVWVQYSIVQYNTVLSDTCDGCWDAAVHEQL